MTDRHAGSHIQFRWELVVTTLVFAFLGINVWAQDAASLPTKYHAGDVQVDASRVYVFVDKTGLGHQHAIEAKLLKSRLILGAEQNAGELVFDMNSFDADTPLARKRLGLPGTTDEATCMAVNENMRGSAVLDVAKYPTATFAIDSSKASGETSDRGSPTFRLKGNFTLHGTTKPLEITVAVEQERSWLRVHGGFAIKQTAYGIKPYSKAFGAIGVADQLKIYGDLLVAPTDQLNLAEIPTKP